MAPLSIAALLLSGCVTSDCRCAPHFDAGADPADAGRVP
jgi:hypothetical protein